MIIKDIIGIYKIENEITNQCYIGSSKNIKKRIMNHKYYLKNNIHHSKYLQRSYEKHGKDCFSFEILEICKIENLLNREQYYIDTLNPKYNGSKTAIVSGKGNRTNHGFKFSEKSLTKMKDEYIARRDYHPSHKLKSEYIPKIIEMFNNDIDISTIALKYNVKNCTILGVLAGRSWKDFHYLVNKIKHETFRNKPKRTKKIKNT